MFCMQPKWLQKTELDGGATHSRQESRLWSRSLAGGSGGVSSKNGDRSHSRGQEEEKNCINGGRGAGFWPILDPIFSSLRPWNAALFIGGGRGTFCLSWCQIVAFGLVGKHPNRCFKVCTSNCQIWQSKAAPVAYFRPVTGAVFMLIGLNG